MLPKFLYHGSLYKQAELMPGFKRSGKLVQWDGIENNTYLYTTTDKNEAIGLGLGSTIEKKFNSRRFSTYDNNIVVYFTGSTPTIEDIHGLEIYVYTLTPTPQDNWVKNNNPFNNIDTEWVTQATIKSITKCERVDIKKWLNNKNLALTTRAIDTCPKQIVNNLSWLKSTRVTN